MPPVIIQLRITAATPLSISAGGSSGSLADKPIVRDGWGRPLIPGSHVKGKLRHAAEAVARSLGYVVAPFQSDVARDDVIQPIFGAPGGPAGAVRFRDLPLVENLPPTRGDRLGLRAGQLRPSVSINRRRGTSEDQRLLIQETTAASVVFEHAQAIVGALDSESQLALLIVAIRLTGRWGGAKSRGLGWATVSAEARWDGAIFDTSEQRLASALEGLAR